MRDSLNIDALYILNRPVNCERVVDENLTLNALINLLYPIISNHGLSQVIFFYSGDFFQFLNEYRENVLQFIYHRKKKFAFIGRKLKLH